MSDDDELDAELLAIKLIAATLDELDVMQCDRVLRWALNRYVDCAV